MLRLAVPEEKQSKATRYRLGPVSISITLATSMGALVLLAVAAVLTIGVTTSQRNTLSLLNQQSQLIVAAMETAVRGHIDPAIDQVDFLARQVESEGLELSDSDRVLDVLTGALAGTPQVGAILTWDPEFRTLGVYSDIERNVGPILADFPNSPDILELLDYMSTAPGLVFGELMYVEGNTYVNLGRTLRRDGVRQGYLGAGVTLQELSRLVTEISDLFGITAFILHGRDRVLAHPFMVGGHPEQSVQNPTVGLTRIGDPVVAAIWSGTPTPGFEDAWAADVNVDTVWLGSREYIVLYRWIDRYGAEPWALGAHFPVELVGEEFRRIQSSILAGIAVLVLSLGAAILLGHVIAAPIKRLAAGAQRVGALDLSNVEALPPSVIRELNDEAHAFNTMLAGLRSFETYVPRTLVRRLIAKGEHQDVRSITRELTVMFTDIVGFTSQSETLPADETAAFLNTHFGMLGRCVEAEAGTIDKYIGDALMAFWSAPDKQRDHARRACRAALAIAATVVEDNRTRAALGLEPIRIRIGIHSGPAVVGNVGAPGRINYTAVGDTVNTAQRLEALGNQVDDQAEVTILISDETRIQIGGAFSIARAGAFLVPGKERPLQVYRLLLPHALTEGR